jgi:hypothetical protein
LSQYATSDFKAPKTWRWWSCVCHRSYPFSQTTKVRSGYQFPKCDNCIRGEVAFCKFWSPDKTPCVCHGCAVGVMGWLRACRQA